MVRLLRRLNYWILVLWRQMLETFLKLIFSWWATIYKDFGIQLWSMSSCKGMLYVVSKFCLGLFCLLYILLQIHVSVTTIYYFKSVRWCLMLCYHYHCLTTVTVVDLIWYDFPFCFPYADILFKYLLCSLSVSRSDPISRVNVCKLEILVFKNVTSISFYSYDLQTTKLTSNIHFLTGNTTVG